MGHFQKLCKKLPERKNEVLSPFQESNALERIWEDKAQDNAHWQRKNRRDMMIVIYYDD
jgi:hypothetical protein